MEQYQSNTIRCDNCGSQGEMGNMRGSQIPVECTECGEEWMVEAGASV